MRLTNFSSRHRVEAAYEKPPHYEILVGLCRRHRDWRAELVCFTKADKHLAITLPYEDIAAMAQIIFAPELQQPVTTRPARRPVLNRRLAGI